MWYYIILHQAGDAYKEAFCLQFDKDPTLRLSDWGYIYRSQVRERICWRRLKTKSMIGPQLCTNCIAPKWWCTWSTAIVCVQETSYWMGN